MLEERERICSKTLSQQLTPKTRRFWRLRRWWNPQRMMASSGRGLGATHGGVRRARTLAACTSGWGEGLHLPTVPANSGAAAFRPVSLDQWFKSTGRKAAGPPAQGGGTRQHSRPAGLVSQPKRMQQHEPEASSLERLSPLVTPEVTTKYPRKPNPRNTQGTGSCAETGSSY